MSTAKQALDGKRPEDWLRPEIMALNAYHVPPAQNMIKLDAMENPYTWPEALQAQWRECLASVAVNRYPDASAAALKEQLKQHFGIAEHQGLLLGNGSDEIIQLLAMALAKPGATLLAPEPGFVMYRMIAEFAGLNYVGVPLDEQFDLDETAMLNAIAEHQPALVFLAVPNNPTGNTFSEPVLRRVVEACPGVVVIDEAYTAFTEADYLPLIEEHSNVLVMRTVSKMGLAGLRLGFLVGAPEWLDELEKMRLPYNINSLTQAAAEFAMRHGEVLTEQSRLLVEQRQRLFDALSAMPQLKVWPSEANFILARCLARPAQDVHAALKQRGILIKCLHGAHPDLDQCLRFTVGTPEEMAALISALSEELVL